jgi:hypothetical protein
MRQMIELTLIAAAVSTVAWAGFLFLMSPFLMGDGAPALAKYLWKRVRGEPKVLQWSHVSLVKTDYVFASSVDLSSIIIDLRPHQDLYIDRDVKKSSYATAASVTIQSRDPIQLLGVAA